MECFCWNIYAISVETEKSENRQLNSQYQHLLSWVLIKNFTYRSKPVKYLVKILLETTESRLIHHRVPLAYFQQERKPMF